MTTACFQVDGTIPEFNDLSYSTNSGYISSSRAVCSNLTLVPSGPGAELAFSPFIFSLILPLVKTAFVSLAAVSMFLNGMFSAGSSLVKTLAKKLFSISAISFSSVISAPLLLLSGPIPVIVLDFDLM